MLLTCWEENEKDDDMSKSVDKNDDVSNCNDFGGLETWNLLLCFFKSAESQKKRPLIPGQLDKLLYMMLLLTCLEENGRDDDMSKKCRQNVLAMISEGLKTQIWACMAERLQVQHPRHANRFELSTSVFLKQLWDLALINYATTLDLRHLFLGILSDVKNIIHSSILSPMKYSHSTKTHSHF